MAYIDLKNDLPGIRGLAAFRPETGQPLYELAQVLLREHSPIPQADRELIAAYVSSINECNFCCDSHAAAARYLYQSDHGLVDLVLADYQQSPIPEKLKSLLRIAGKVAGDARTVNDSDITFAREQGADDREIHDTVLIAAAFCMFNRYVDGLGAETPTDPKVYAEMGVRMGTAGYIAPKK